MTIVHRKIKYTDFFYASMFFFSLSFWFQFFFYCNILCLERNTLNRYHFRKYSTSTSTRQNNQRAPLLFYLIFFSMPCWKCLHLAPNHYTQIHSISSTFNTLMLSSVYSLDNFIFFNLLRYLFEGDSSVSHAPR